MYFYDFRWSYRLEACLIEGIIFDAKGVRLIKREEKAKRELSDFLDSPIVAFIPH